MISFICKMNKYTVKCSDIQTHALTPKMNEPKKKDREKLVSNCSKRITTHLFIIFSDRMSLFCDIWLARARQFLVVVYNFGMCCICRDSINYTIVSTTRPGDDSYFLLLYFRSINIIISISILVLFFCVADIYSVKFLHR